MRVPPQALTDGLARAKDRQRRFEAATAIMQGLAAGLNWQPGLMVHAAEMASDAVGLADALLNALEK